MSLAHLKNNQSSIEDIKRNFGLELEIHQNEARLLTNDEGIIIYASENFSNVCGYNNEVDGLRVTDLIAFDIPKAINQNGEFLGRFVHSGADFSFNLNWVVSEHQKILILSAQPVLEYIEQSSSQDKNLFSNLSFDAQIICDENGVISNTNHNFNVVFGDIIPAQIHDLVHCDDQNAFHDFFNNHNTQHLTTRAINDKNQPLWIMWAIEKNNDQTYLIARNITERETHRIELEEHKSHIIEAEAIAEMGQWEWVVGHEEINMSEQLFTIFGFDIGRDKPTLHDINDMIHDADDGRMMQVFQRAIIEQNNYDMDFRIKRCDGKTRYIRCEGRCRVDHEDDVIALYGIMQDVTETMTRENDLVKAKENVEKAYAAKTQFLANMSHELRTPLNAVIGFSEMMERQLLGPIGNDKYLDYISGIRKSGEHLLSLISDILDMSKIEAGKYELSLEEFNLIKTARLAVHMVEGRAMNDNVKIIVQAISQKIDIVADRRAIMQIVLNLLSNAVKFSHKDNVVTLTIEERENFAFITVQDNGIGIPANKLARITEPFEQVENHYSREYEGTGLGLSITKELTQIHGGEINIESTVDVGTTVLIKLPLKTIC